jgi:hypothetical protein
VNKRAPRRLAVERLQVHPNRFRWPKRLARRLGRMPDRDVAALAGLSKDAAIEERRRRGIRAFRTQRRPVEWTDRHRLRGRLAQSFSLLLVLVA